MNVINLKHNKIYKKGEIIIKLSFKFKPKLNHEQLAIIEDLSFHTTKLYNTVNYELINNGFKKYTDIEKLFKANWHCDFLHSHTRQHCFKVVEHNWKAFLSASKDYKKNPSKYLGVPRQPGYKNVNDRKNEVIFTNLAIRFKDNQLILSLSKAMQSLYKVKSLNIEVSSKLQSLIDFNNIQQIRIKYDRVLKSWCFIIIYNKEEVVNTTNNNVMAIDLGLNNLATLTFKDNVESYIINGKPLKSVNSYTNKKISHLQSISMCMKGSKNFKNTKQIIKLRRYRESYINDYLHKASSKIIDVALLYQVDTIVIGDISLIKQNMNFNKTFVQIPIQKLVNLISYKAKLSGIVVVLQKEAYTSGCSSLDLEPIEKVNYNKSRRIQRGLFKSNTGIYINADVNGSLNILRLYIKDEGIPKLIQLARDKGYVNNPVKLRVA